MVAYQFYWRDEKEKTHFIGILPERRKKPGRITTESILNWGWKAIGDHLRDPLIIPNSSLPRRRESSYVKNLWIPAFAGMTFLEVALNLI
jgi:hypothetical protein